MNALSPVLPRPVADIIGLQPRRPKLLVVDDQAANIQALYQAFATDHQVFMATGGEQALALCANKQPDLVLLDVVMPGMDGYEVCRQMKADPETRDIPVIFVTSHSDEESEASALDAGAVDFITKPINQRIVRARVKTHLTLKAQTDLLRHWVYIDGLTGIHNRRYFDERLAAEWRRALRAALPLSVVMMDVDFFKRYNDRHGHQAGDDCLRRVAGALKSGLSRAGDMVARYGGEEFVCLLPDTDLTGAMHVAAALGQAVDAQRIEHGDSDTAPFVSLSLGVCTRTARSLGSAVDLLRQSDAQLYRAKLLGRHRVCGEEMAP